MYKTGKTQRGITLIALVITIIVMLILVGVTISMAVNGGLFDYAGRAVSETNNALKAEQDLASGGVTIDGTYYNSIDEYLETKNGGEKVETISKTESYIGYYADVDGDETVDGIIYADLAIGGEGGFDEHTYSYEAVVTEELKDYYVSGTYHGDFDENGKEVLTATGEGKDRFYVMALSDFAEAGDTYSWYWNAIGENENSSYVTSENFGTGKANTDAMITKWKASDYGEQYESDVWKYIQTLVLNGWFVPSIGEWSAFYNAFKPTSEWTGEMNEILTISHGLSEYYWSSSQEMGIGELPYWTYFVWNMGFASMDSMADMADTTSNSVRLSTTF